MKRVTSTDMLLLAWMPVPVCLMYCLNCCRLSSTARRSSSPPLAAPLTHPSPGIDLSSSTQERSLARLPRTCYRYRGKTKEKTCDIKWKQHKTRNFDLSYHKWEKTFLLPADGVQAEQRYPAGAVQTACQGQEVLQSITEHHAGLWPRGGQCLHDQDPGWLPRKRGGPVNRVTRVGRDHRSLSVVHWHLKAQHTTRSIT